MKNFPDYLHFFSWHSKISFELPLGFEEELEDADTNSAVYADDLDDEDESGARVMTKASAVPEDEDEAFLKLADESLNIIGSEAIDRTRCEIDGATAITQLFSYYHEELESEVIRHETFAQIGNVVFSITCLAPAERAMSYRSVFEHAARSARFVLL